MTIWNRLLLFFLCFLTAILALVLFFASWGIGTSLPALFSYVQQWCQLGGAKEMVAIGSLLGFVLSLRFLFYSLSIRKALPDGIECGTEIGQVQISLHTISSLATDVARRVKGVRDVKARVRYLKEQDSVTIGIQVVVDGHIPIQEVTGQLQERVKEQVERVAGIRVDQVPVYVDHMKQVDRSKVQLR